MEERLSSKFLRDAQAVPLHEDDEELALAIADPSDSYARTRARSTTSSTCATSPPRRRSSAWST
jgi:hypothetical protein